MLPGRRPSAWPRRPCCFEEFLARRGGRRAHSRPIGRHQGKVVLHGHCHQKAFGAMGAVGEALALIEGSRSKPWSRAAAAWPAPSAIGADTYEVSLAMGELSPAAGRAPSGAGRHHRRRRLLLPPPDPRRHRPHAAPRRPHPAPGHDGCCRRPPSRDRDHARGCDQWRSAAGWTLLGEKVGCTAAQAKPTTRAFRRPARRLGRKAMAERAARSVCRHARHPEVAARLRRRAVPHWACRSSAMPAASACRSGSSPASAPD